MPDPHQAPGQSERVMWVCALHHMHDADPGDDCPRRDREDGSLCGAPVTEVVFCSGCSHPADDCICGFEWDDEADDHVSEWCPFCGVPAGDPCNCDAEQP